MLRIKNLTKTFGDKKVINNIDLEVPTGGVAVMLGASGVGKSTLLRILNNLETYDSGTIILDGKPLDVKTVNQTHVIGMVFQHFNLFDHLSVLENITLSLEKSLNKSKKESEKIALQLLERFGLAEKARAHVSDLSGGQKQRLALARTIALRPKVLCMDEPTSALDPLLTTHVANTLQDLAGEGYTVLIATHDTALLDKLDCMIYLMDSGNIVESVSSKFFAQNKNAYPRIKSFVAGNTE